MANLAYQVDHFEQGWVTVASLSPEAAHKVKEWNNPDREGVTWRIIDLNAPAPEVETETPETPEAAPAESKLTRAPRAPRKAAPAKVAPEVKEAPQAKPAEDKAKRPTRARKAAAAPTKKITPVAPALFSAGAE